MTVRLDTDQVVGLIVPVDFLAAGLCCDFPPTTDHNFADLHREVNASGGLNK